jgi:DNA-binding SARP family transcriptional activator
MMSPRFNLRTFGGLFLTSTGGERSFLSGQRKRLALLAVLAADGNGGVSRDRLLALFWPESDADRARNSLAQMLYAIRRELGADCVDAGAGDLRLNREVVESDIRRFWAALSAGDLAGAVNLYQGPFLDGIYLRDLGPFDRWTEDTRHALATAYVRALETLAQDALQAGAATDAVAWSRKLSSADPLNSGATLLLMRALELAGDVGSAIRSSEVHASLLEQELAVGLPEQVVREVHRLRATTSTRSQPAIVSPPVGVEAVTRDEMTEADDVPVAGVPASSSRRGLLIGVAAAGLLAGAALAASAIAVRHRTGTPLVIAVAAPRASSGDSAIARVNSLAAVTLAQQIVQTHRSSVIDLRVWSANANTHSASAAEDVALARRAGADRVLTSEIDRAGDSVLVRMQILDTKDGRVSDQLDPVTAPRGQAEEIIDRVRDEAAGAVAALADTAYRAWAVAGARLPGYAAYSEFKMGLEAILHAWHPQAEGPEPAIEHLRNAARLDTTFLQAKVWLLAEADLDPSRKRFADSVQAALLKQRARGGPFDQASIDEIVARRAADWEGSFQAARRMVTVAPSVQDGHVALTRAAMATRRYAEAIRTLHQLAELKGWLSELNELWQWDIQAHHLTGDDKGALAHWKELRSSRTPETGYCPWAIPSLVALDREAAVDSLVAECVKTDPYPAPNIPDRIYFDNVLPEYVARRNLAAARRVVARIRPEFERYAARMPPKAHDLAYMECMLGEWETCYTHLRASIDTSRTTFLDMRRLAVAAAHVGDSAMANAALRWFDANAPNEHRGWTPMFKAMIVSASGDKIGAAGLMAQAMNEGVAPCGCEWQSWPNHWGRGPEWFSNWHSMWELQPLRGFRAFDLLVRERH